jgi:hypothetical protein
MRFALVKEQVFVFISNHLLDLLLHFTMRRKATALHLLLGLLLNGWAWSATILRTNSYCGAVTCHCLRTCTRSHIHLLLRLLLLSWHVSIINSIPPCHESIVIFLFDMKFVRSFLSIVRYHFLLICHVGILRIHAWALNGWFSRTYLLRSSSGKSTSILSSASTSNRRVFMVTIECLVLSRSRVPTLISVVEVQ